MELTNDQTKKERPSAEDWKKWGEEVYLVWYSNPKEPPPPPPGPVEP